LRSRLFKTLRARRIRVTAEAGTYIDGVSLLARLTRVLLISVTLCGGGGLPVLDAVSHLYGATGIREPHFETAAASVAHGEFCSLGSSLPYTAHAPPPSLDLPLSVLVFPQTASLASTLRSADHRRLPPTRAPPPLFA
jgi:hypothetical protein